MYFILITLVVILKSATSSCFKRCIANIEMVAGTIVSVYLTAGLKITCFYGPFCAVRNSDMCGSTFEFARGFYNSEKLFLIFSSALQHMLFVDS